MDDQAEKVATAVMSAPMAWLTASHGLELTDVEIDAIRDFTLIWGLFEGKTMDTRGSQDRLAAAVERMGLSAPLPAAFHETLAFWRERYWYAGDPTHAFWDLKFSDNPHLENVRSVLSGANDAPRNVATAMLQIAMRLRNNLFHGAKWRYGISGQLENFNHANAILMDAIQMSPEVA